MAVLAESLMELLDEEREDAVPFSAFLQVVAPARLLAGTALLCPALPCSCERLACRLACRLPHARRAPLRLQPTYPFTRAPPVCLLLPTTPGWRPLAGV